MGGGSGSNGGGVLFYIREIKILKFFQTQKLSKFKKSNEKFMIFWKF